VADFCNGHAGAVEIQKIFLNFFQYTKGQGGRSRIKVVDSVWLHIFPPFRKGP
jgi:hypothetical protein